MQNKYRNKNYRLGKRSWFSYEENILGLFIFASAAIMAGVLIVYPLLKI